MRSLKCSFLAAALLAALVMTSCSFAEETLPTAKELYRDHPVSEELIRLNPATDPLLVLVNKKVELTSHYVPEVRDVNVPWKYDNDPVQMVPEAAEALERLVAASVEAGYDLKAISGYRSYSRQKRTYAASLNDPSSGGAVLNAKEGCSEHQTGLAVDISGKEARYNEVQYYGETESGIWLQEHCAEFGFVIRFRAEWRSVTGYKAEPWHLRYVGTEHARAITEMNVPFETYLEYLTLAWQDRVERENLRGTLIALGTVHTLSASGSTFLLAEPREGAEKKYEIKNWSEDVGLVSVEGGWAKVNCSGRIGYVPLENVYGEPMDTKKTTTTSVRLRRAAAADSAAVTTVPSDRSVRVYAILNGEWAFVKVKSDYGFINLKYLR